MAVDPEFIQHILNGLAYWREHTAEINPTTVSSLIERRRSLHRIVQYGAALTETRPLSAEVALQSFDFVEQQGYWLEWLPIFQKLAGRCSDRAHAYKLYCRLGQLQRNLRQFPEAIASHQSALDIAEQMDNPEALGEVHYNLAEDFFRCRDESQSIFHGQTALSLLAPLSGTERFQAGTLTTLANEAKARGDVASAEAYLRQAVDLRRQANDTVRLARTLSELGSVLINGQKYKQAEKSFRESAKLLAPTNNYIDKAIIQSNLGAIFHYQKQWAKAEQAYRQANSSHLRQSAHTFSKASISHNLGEVLYKQGKFELAEEYLQQAVARWEKAQEPFYLANSLATLGDLEKTRGNSAEAQAYFHQALDALNELDAQPAITSFADKIQAKLDQL